MTALKYLPFSSLLTQKDSQRKTCIITTGLNIGVLS